MHLPHFVEGHLAADFDPAVGERSAEQDGTMALVDGYWAGQLGAEGQRGGAGCLVLDDAGCGDEGAGVDRSRSLVDPSPGVDVRVLRRRGQGAHLSRRVEPAVLEPRRPLWVGGDVGRGVLIPHPNLSRRWQQRLHRRPFPRQQPGGADGGVAGERKLYLRRVDAHPRGGAIVDEDRLAEAELRSDRLPRRLRHPVAFEEDTKRVAPLAVLVDEDTEDVEGWHAIDLRSIDYLGAMKALCPRFASLTLGLIVATLCAANANALELHHCDLGAKRPFRCGHVTVPLRRGDPSLGSTRIAFAVRPRSDRHHRSLGTILASDGGPGYASTDGPYVRSLSAVLAPLLRRRDLVFVDARGTGRSGVIDCPALQGGLIQEDIAVGECADQLGPRYAAYTTAETAHDLDAVRRALGVGRVFFYGDSYATLLGQAYAVRYASRLRGLILDSAYPADDPYYRTLLPAGRRALSLACRHSPDCTGNAAARFGRVVNRFHAHHRSVEGLLRFLLDAGTLAPRSYLGLDDGVRRFLGGDPRRLERLIAPGAAGHGDLGEFSYGLEIAVECNDYPLLWDPRAPVGERIRQLSAAAQRLPADHFAPFGRREYLLSTAAHLTSCLTWPAPPDGGLEPPVPSDWSAPRSFPTLILAGQLDDITSVAEARQVQARFPRSRLYVVPNRGHASSLYFPFRSPAVGAIRAFVRVR